MKVTLKNSSLKFANATPEQTYTITTLKSVYNINDAYCATADGSNYASSAFKGYYADLTGLYAQGYRKVKFKANKTQSAIVMGAVCTTGIPTSRATADEVESYIPNDVDNSNVAWYELPITANSKCLHATRTVSSTYGEILVVEEGIAIASTRSVATT